MGESIVVRVGGLEPPRPWAKHFKCHASTIPPHPHSALLIVRSGAGQRLPNTQELVLLSVVRRILLWHFPQPIGFNEPRDEAALGTDVATGYVTAHLAMKYRHIGHGCEHN